MIHIGCCGWPLSRAEYFRRFSTVEINTSFYNLPQLATAARWREEAPEGFEFSLKAWQLITHPSSSPTYRRLTARLSPRRLAQCGHFKATDEATSAWERTQAVARALGCRFVLFQTPSSFYPGADHVRDMTRFFKSARRGDFLFAWEPRGRSWEEKLVRRLCGDLGLIHAYDPLAPQALETAAGSRRGPVYFRMHGAHEGNHLVYGHRYSDQELERLKARCGSGPAFVFFNNASMGEDAMRFQEITR